MPDERVGSDWFGVFLSCAPRIAARHQLNNKPAMAAFSGSSPMPRGSPSLMRATAAERPTATIAHPKRKLDHQKPALFRSGVHTK